MKKEELKDLLDGLYEKYNNTDFIADDPISVPHSFTSREDREISGFLAATIAWGNRKAIVKNARRMMRYMDDHPYEFTLNASENELNSLATFVHRTFNGEDFQHFVMAIRNVCNEYGGLGSFFENEYSATGDMREVISRFRQNFFALDHPHRCEKHLSSVDKGSACKRLNMYFRWMVRRDGNGVDFGMWDIPMSALYLPLDVHAGNMGRALGLLGRKQNDWKAVEEITAALREFDTSDPVKYDFALFGAGISGYLKN